MLPQNASTKRYHKTQAQNAITNGRRVPRRALRQRFIQVSDLDGNGLKGQKHQAQGKRSDTLGIACWSSRALKGQKL